MIRKKKQERELTKLERRVEAMPTSELIPWTEQYLYSVGRNLSSWQKSQDIAYLEEARVAAEVVHTIVESLKRRNVNV